MLPLLLGAGRLLAAGAVRGATTGAVRSAMGKAVVDGVKKKAIGKLTSKKTNISKEKLLGKPGALVKIGKRPSALVKRNSFSNKGSKPSTESIKESKKDKKKTFDPILKEVLNIKGKLIKIESFLQSNLDRDKSNLTRKRIQLSKEKSEAKERQLESKKRSSLGKSIVGAVKPKGSLFDTILNFLTWTFFGSLANFAFSKLPEIIQMFTEISSGFNNIWKVIKTGIISLTTNFPRLIKKLAVISGKVFGGPAKFIGKLILKAGGLVKNLFMKAGKAVFNIIKEPLKRLLGPAATSALKGISQGVGSVVKRGVGKTATRLAAKIGGKGAAKVVAGAGNTLAKTAPAVFRRFKKISGIFKKVPVIGALIGIGIDLALGEKLDRALAGAAGASLGAAIGGAIGTGLIPIPVVGTAVGGFVGSAVGDWAGKKIYSNLKSKVFNDEKVERKSIGGVIGGFFSRLTGGNKRTSTTRVTSVSKRSVALRAKDTIKSANPSQPIKKEVVTEAEKYFGKGPTSRLVRVSEAFRSMSFVGDLMKMGVGIAMGHSFTRNEVKTAADSISSDIGFAIRGKLIKSFGLSEDDVGKFSESLSTWATDAIYNQLSSRRDEFAFRKGDKVQESSDESSGKGGGGGGSDEDLGPVDPIKPGPMHQKGAQIAKNLMRLLGIKDYQAAGIVGNIIQESSLVPDILEGGRRGTLQQAMNQGLGYSYPQWTDPGRQRNFANYLESKGHDWRRKGATDELATGFLAQEFKGYMSNVFTGTKNAAAASTWVLKNYEKPADQGPREQKERAADSQAVLNKMGGGASSPKQIGGGRNTFHRPQVGGDPVSGGGRPQVGGGSGTGTRGGVSVTSNSNAGNKQLKPGKTYGYSSLGPHHSDANSIRTYAGMKIGYPKDYGMGVLPNYMPSGPNGKIPLPVSGKVLIKEWHKGSGYGRTVVVETSLGKMQFSHLSKFGSFKVGDQLSAGTIIGVQGGSGATETSYAEHLHLNASKKGHEAFVNFITSGKPTTGSVDSPGNEDQGNDQGVDSTETEPPEMTLEEMERYSFDIRGDVARADLLADPTYSVTGTQTAVAPSTQTSSTPTKPSTASSGTVYDKFGRDPSKTPSKAQFEAAKAARERALRMGYSKGSPEYERMVAEATMNAPTMANIGPKGSMLPITQAISSNASYQKPAPVLLPMPQPSASSGGGGVSASSSGSASLPSIDSNFDIYKDVLHVSLYKG